VPQPKGKNIRVNQKRKITLKTPFATRMRVFSSAEASSEPTGSGYYGFETACCVTEGTIFSPGKYFLCNRAPFSYLPFNLKAVTFTATEPIYDLFTFMVPELQIRVDDVMEDKPVFHS
jgi:hypothetical protein